MNAVLAFVASYVMVFFTMLILAAVLFGLLLASLDLCQTVLRWKAAGRSGPTRTSTERQVVVRRGSPPANDVTDLP